MPPSDFLPRVAQQSRVPVLPEDLGSSFAREVIVGRWLSPHQDAAIADRDHWAASVPPAHFYSPETERWIRLRGLRRRRLTAHKSASALRIPIESTKTSKSEGSRPGTNDWCHS